jgi:hypothetical protein
MDINRPSLRVAFGNKEELSKRALATREDLSRVIERAMPLAHLNGSDVEPLILEVEIAADP